MTDAQIIEALGWPAQRPDVHPRSLFLRVRAVVAAAQAEQSERIERMRAALVEARLVIDEDRRAVLVAHTDPAGAVDADGASWAVEYDEVLEMIDAALEGKAC